MNLSTATIVQSPISSGKVLSAFRLADDKIGLVLSQRDAKFEAFKKAKDTAGLYASERLIKNRQEVINELRMLRNSYNGEKMSIFTRGGVPMVQLESAAHPVEIRTLEDLDIFRQELPSQRARHQRSVHRGNPHSRPLVNPAIPSRTPQGPLHANPFSHYSSGPASGFLTPGHALRHNIPADFSRGDADVFTGQRWNKTQQRLTKESNSM